MTWRGTRPSTSSARTAARSPAAGRASATACGEWNTLVEEGVAAPAAGARGRAPAQGPRCSRSSRSPAKPQEAPRLPSGVAEFDRVTGGGFVRGSVLLMAGDPGIGKSTLLIQAAAALAQRRPPRGLYLRRRGGGAGAASRRAARPRRRRGRARRRNLGRGHHRHAVGGQDAAPRRHRFDPDHVDRRDRIRARHGHAGARLGAGADPLRQALRRRASSWSATSPRTARSPAPAWSSTWSTPCCRSRAKARTSSASCAR